MPFQGRHVETGSLLGSWPILPSVITGSTVLLPRTMQSKATILGIKREPAAGYDVDGRSFVINVDSVDKNISFSYGAFLPLSVVISQINADAGLTIAFNDNGFLRLQSPTTGGVSYLKVKVDTASTPTNVLVNLGLFPEIEAYAGDLTPAQHVDPDRQIATPSQMTMAEGENFEARVFNRAIAQLSVNNDRNEGLLSKKRVATRSTFSVGSYSPGAAHGVQLTGGNLVYVGKVTSPSITALEKLFAVLDSEGRELSKDLYFPAGTGFSYTFFTSTDGSNRQEVSSSFFDFATETTYEPGNYFLLSTAFTGGATALNGKPLKILEIRTGSGLGRAIIENIDPATGQRVTITDSSISCTIVNRNRAKVVVDGVFENVTTAAAGTPRLENSQVVKRSSLTPTRMELGNRIVVVGQDFNSSPAIKVGDLITWASSTINTPFNNNGNYRVDKIIDKETLQVVAADWGAAILNPNTTGGSVGTITIKNDGAFVLDPFLRFPNNNFNPPPTTGEAIELAFLKGTTIRQATDDNPAIFQDDVRFTQEADETLARAITRMWGPSVTSLDGVLYGDYRLNLEHINAKQDFEHYTYNDAEKAGSSSTGQFGTGILDTRSWGRHKDIRPDTIDMWYWDPADLSTPRITLRGYGRYGKYQDTNTDRMDSLLQVKDAMGIVNLQIDSAGHITNFQDIDTAGDGYGNRVWMDIRFHNPRADVGSYGSSLPTLGGYFVSGDRIIQRLMHRWYNALDSGSGVTLIGSTLDTDFALTSSSAVRFDAIIGQRIQHFATVNNIVGANDIKWLELTGTLSKGTNQADNEDAYFNMYGIHIKYTLDSDIKIYNDHYGLKIEDITRAGTGFGGPTGTNYSIYTGEGIVRFGNRLLAGNIAAVSSGAFIDFDQTDATGSTTATYALFARRTVEALGSATSMFGGLFHAQTGHSTGTLASLTGLASETYSYTSGSGVTTLAIGGDFRVLQPSGGTITSMVGVRIRSSTPAGTVTNRYGLLVEDQSGGTTNYAIYTGSGVLRFGDAMQIGTSPDLTEVPFITSNVSQDGTAGAQVAYKFRHTPTGSVAYARDGMIAYSDISHTSGVIASVKSFRTFCTHGDGGSTTEYMGVMAGNASVSTGTITTFRALSVSTPSISGTGAITSWYGLYVDAPPASTNKFAIFTNGGQVHIAADGLVVGAAPTGGDLGTGTINVATNVYKNNIAYTNPDYVLEQAFTGKIERYKDREGAAGYKWLSLSEVEAYAKEHLRLPRIEDKPTGIFTMADIALEKIEELYLHLFEKDHQIKRLESKMAALELQMAH